MASGCQVVKLKYLLEQINFEEYVRANRGNNRRNSFSNKSTFIMLVHKKLKGR